MRKLAIDALIGIGFGSLFIRAGWSPLSSWEFWAGEILVVGSILNQI